MWLVGDLQLPTAVNDVGLQTIEGLDFRVSAAFAQIQGGNIPEGITLNYRMDAVVIGAGFSRTLHRIDSNTIIGEHIGAGVLVRSRLCVGEDTVSTHLGLAVLPGLTHTVIAGSQLFRIGHHRLGGVLCILFGIGGKQSLDLGTEGIHALAVLREPVHHITVVGCDTLLVALGVADDVLLGQTIFFAEIGTKFDGLTVHLLEIGVIRKTVLADFKADVSIIGAAAGVPSTVIPRESLVSSNGAICQFADESVDTDLSAAGMIGVPVVAVLVFTEQTVIRTNIAFQIGVVRTGGMNHDTLDGNGATCLVAGIFRKDQFMQIHYRHLLGHEAVPGLPSAFRE